MIPKIIHYCWFGETEMPPLELECIKTWKEYLHDYKIVRWDESNCPRNNYIVHHLDKGNWAYLSDYVRLYALYETGGIYLDTDVEVIQSFDELLNNNGFLGYQEDGQPTNAVAGSVKGNEYFSDCMGYIINRFELNLDYHIAPIMSLNVRNLKQYDITIFEKEYFYPYNPYGHTQDIKILMFNMIKTNTYAIHHWAYSWKPKSENKNKKRTGLCHLAYRICTKLSKMSRRYFKW